MKLVVAWLIVAIPAAWGVAQTVRQSMKLFLPPDPAPAMTQVAPR